MIVREDHSQAERSEPENLIVCINQKNGEEVLVVRLIFLKVAMLRKSNEC